MLISAAKNNKVGIFLMNFIIKNLLILTIKLKLPKPISQNL